MYTSANSITKRCLACKHLLDGRTKTLSFRHVFLPFSAMVEAEKKRNRDRQRGRYYNTKSSITHAVNHKKWFTTISFLHTKNCMKRFLKAVKTEVVNSGKKNKKLSDS